MPGVAARGAGCPKKKKLKTESYTLAI